MHRCLPRPVARRPPETQSIARWGQGGQPSCTQTSVVAAQHRAQHRLTAQATWTPSLERRGSLRHATGRQMTCWFTSTQVNVQPPDARLAPGAYVGLGWVGLDCSYRTEVSAVSERTWRPEGAADETECEPQSTQNGGSCRNCPAAGDNSTLKGACTSVHSACRHLSVSALENWTSTRLLPSSRQRIRVRTGADVGSVLFSATSQQQRVLRRIEHALVLHCVR